MEQITFKVSKSKAFLVLGIFIGLLLGFGGKYALDYKTGYALPKDNSKIENTGPKIDLSKDDHFRGSKKPKAYFVTFSDFQCPYCQNFHSTMKQALDVYGDNIAWVMRHFPLSFHEQAAPAAIASECASEQGKFWEYADLMFENMVGDGSALQTDDLKNYASLLGLDEDRFNSCLIDKKYEAKVMEQMQTGIDAGVQGTPATIIIKADGSTKLIEGALPFEQIKPEIDKALE